MEGRSCQCPRIELADWRDREVTLQGHWFLRSPTPLFLHVPRRLHQDLEALEARIDGARYHSAGVPLVLHRDGWFAGEVLLSIEPPGQGSAPALSFQNLFYSRVVENPGFDAALRTMPGFFRDLRSARVGPIECMYFWYLNCPRCLVERGAGRIILLARSSRLLASSPYPLGAAPARGGAILPCQP